MAEIYGHRWTSAYGEDASKGAGQTWSKGLAQLSVEQIASGIESIVKAGDAWPPTLPEFRFACMHIPSIALVRRTLRYDYERTGAGFGFARLVWNNLDGYRFRNGTAELADRMIAEAYELAVVHVMSGGQIPSPSAAIAAEKQEPRKPVDRELCKARVAEIDALLGGDGHATAQG